MSPYPDNAPAPLSGHSDLCQRNRWCRSEPANVKLACLEGDLRYDLSARALPPPLPLPQSSLPLLAPTPCTSWTWPVLPSTTYLGHRQDLALDKFWIGLRQQKYPCSSEMYVVVIIRNSFSLLVFACIIKCYWSALVVCSSCWHQVSWKCHKDFPIDGMLIPPTLRPAPGDIGPLHQEDPALEQPWIKIGISQWGDLLGQRGGREDWNWVGAGSLRAKSGTAGCMISGRVCHRILTPTSRLHGPPWFCIH